MKFEFIFLLVILFAIYMVLKPSRENYTPVALMTTFDQAVEEPTRGRVKFSDIRRERYYDKETGGVVLDQYIGV